MQWATGAACQTYFETLSFQVSFQNQILEQTVHVLHCLFLWSEIQWQGLAAALSESKKHSSVLLWPRGEAS